MLKTFCFLFVDNSKKVAFTATLATNHHSSNNELLIFPTTCIISTQVKFWRQGLDQDVSGWFALYLWRWRRPVIFWVLLWYWLCEKKNLHCCLIKGLIFFWNLRKKTQFYFFLLCILNIFFCNEYAHFILTVSVNIYLITTYIYFFFNKCWHLYFLEVLKKKIESWRGSSIIKHPNYV